MSTERDATRIVRSWLEEGVTALPDRVLDAVLDQVPATPQRRSWWPARRVPHVSNPVRYAIAGAAVLLVAIVGLRVLTPVSSLGPPGVMPTPTPTASPAPTAMALPAQGSLVQGSYFLTSSAALHVTFTVPSGRWQVNAIPDVIWTEDSGGRISFARIDNLYRDHCDPGRGLREPALGATVDELATALSLLPGRVLPTPSDVSVGGHPGKLVELNIPARSEACAGADLSLFPTPQGPAPLDGDARHRFWIIEVGGTRLVVHAVERADLQPVWRNELQAIVDSIRIEAS